MTDQIEPTQADREAADKAYRALLDDWDDDESRGCLERDPAEAIAAWNTRTPSPSGARETEHPVFEFLLGSGELEGHWFGDRNPTERGAFWWRKHLREALSALRSQGRGEGE